jgi:hypothetical protein
MKASNKKLSSANFLATSALATVMALSLLSTSASAQDDLPSTNALLKEHVVKGTEYQPNFVTADGSHLKIKKHMSDGKPLAVKGKQVAPLLKPEKGLSRESARSNDDADFWIYDSYVTLTSDLDYDGYYSSFKLEFDVDTIYQTAPIYAVIYTSTSDVFTPFYTTDIYNIHGDNTDDAIIVENDLVSGFPSDDYEIMIVIYDADTDEIVAVSDGTDDADLAYLSLESENHEYVETVEVVEVVVVEHGGALGSILIAGIGFVMFRRNRA